MVGLLYMFKILACIMSAGIYNGLARPRVPRALRCALSIHKSLSGWGGGGSKTPHFENFALRLKVLKLVSMYMKKPFSPPV